MAVAWLPLELAAEVLVTALTSAGRLLGGIVPIKSFEFTGSD